MLWDAAVNAVDEADGAPNQFLLTGSATPVRADREDGVHVVLIGCLAH